MLSSSSLPPALPLSQGWIFMLHNKYNEDTPLLQPYSVNRFALRSFLLDSFTHWGKRQTIIMMMIIIKRNKDWKLVLDWSVVSGWKFIFWVDINTMGDQTQRSCEL